MAGRSLGHTGGTLDKLEAIPGFQSSLSIDEMIKAVQTCGIAVVGQTANLVPADKKLYALARCYRYRRQPALDRYQYHE